MPLTQTVFITGASSGIGSAFARYYAVRGARLGLAARRANELAQLAEELTASGAEIVHCYPLDVTDIDALAQAANDFVTHVGVPDTVLACAGVSSGTLTECPEDLASIRRIFEINVIGMAATFSPFIAPMRAARAKGCVPGRLVGIASVAGIRGLPGSEAYSASKSAVITYLESLRLEMRDSGIKVVTLVPGYIATPMTAINSYRMPFLTPVDEAVKRFAKAIAEGSSYSVVPWQMGVVAKLLRLLPNWLYDLLFAHAPHKKKVLKLPNSKQ